MNIERIVPNLTVADLRRSVDEHAAVLGLEVVMDHGWIVTHASPLEAPAQLSFAREGGSGTDVPDFSIEVDNFDEVRDRIVAAGLPIEYGPTVESWGVRRLFVRDPFGKLVNILSHL